jgi:hypothetical protein
MATEADENADVYAALGGIRENAPNPGAENILRQRLEMLRTWIHPADWENLCRALPEASHWFDDEGRSLRPEGRHARTDGPYPCI